MYRNQMMESTYGPANMLGKVLIFVAFAIVATAFGIVGCSHMIRDLNTNRLMNEEAARQAEVREGATAGAIALQNANYEAQAMRTKAQAEADAEASREKSRLIHERNTQALEREKLIGEVAIYIGALAAAGAVVVVTFAGLRLVNRLLPAQARRPVTQAAQPPVRQRPSAAPAPVVLTVDDPAFQPSANGSGTQRSRSTAAPLNPRPVLAL